MTSLRIKLNQYIQQNQVVSYGDIKQKVESGFFGKVYRMSNAERRLRQSESPDIEAEIIDGVIRNYKWIGEPLKYRLMKVEGSDTLVKLYN